MLALFAGECYYPGGGWSDFRGTGTMEELKQLYEKEGHQWGQIVDLTTLKIVVETWESRNDWK
jgi:hypothetical protein